MNSQTFRFFSCQDNSLIDKIPAVNSWKAQKEFCSKHPEYTMNHAGRYYFDIEQKEGAKDCFAWNF